uniref:Uncharacterized protein n=1 Tax=Lepeophtheirus salmonis TaxID=72036 RepID=A0A0K2TX66_LEPSM
MCLKQSLIAHLPAYHLPSLPSRPTLKTILLNSLSFWSTTHSVYTVAAPRLYLISFPGHEFSRDILFFNCLLSNKVCIKMNQDR